jgi:hypothetical protein
VVAKHFHRITVLTGQVGKYSDDRSFGVVAECLIDLVTNYRFEAMATPSAAMLCAQ